MLISKLFHVRFLKITAAAFAVVVLLSVFVLSKPDLSNSIKYNILNKSGLCLAVEKVNPLVEAVSADPANRLYIKVSVRDSSGLPVQGALVELSVGGPGAISQPSARTDESGEIIAAYVPPATLPEKSGDDSPKAAVNAVLAGSDKTAELEVKLTRTPVVLVHGYQSSGDIFENLKEYLEGKGFASSAVNYSSEAGVAAGAKELESFLRQLKSEYLSKGIQTSRFDVIAHSMGGLVARYYTCSDEYIKNNDIRKLIFLSVPHKGSSMASLGVEYFNDEGMRDLVPQSELFTNILPSMINKGLNSTIQTGNILGQYDEVVSTDSASLSEWNIMTEMFNLGDRSFSVNSLLDVSSDSTQIHKLILNNSKVYERIAEMLGTELPFPAIKK